MKKKQYLVIGLGRFGSAIATTLYDEGEEVMAVDSQMDVVEAHRNRLTNVVQADAMEKVALEQIGAAGFDVVVVTIGSDIRVSGTVTMLLKEMGAPCVIAKASDEFFGRMLTKLGADKVIFPERDMGVRIAHNLISSQILDFIVLSPDYSLMEIEPRADWVGHTLRELNLRDRAHVNVVAIREDEAVDALPGPNTCLKAGSTMLVVAQKDATPGK